jgi:predicted enzyme related to lactoylglutathione lyase
MMEIRPREPVILASDFKALVSWYREALGFTVVNLFEDGFHYCNLETPTGFRLGIADAEEMRVAPGDRRANTVVMQYEVDDIHAFFAHLEGAGASITGGPSRSEEGGFGFGSFSDPEGNPSWVVEAACP